MSELDFRREIVSDLFDGLVGSNVADSGLYTPPGGSPVPCRMKINRGAGAIGNFARAGGEKLSVLLVLGDLTTSPARAATVSVTSIAAGTETFTLLQRISDDAAIAEWAVERV